MCPESGGTKLAAALADPVGRLIRVVRRSRPPDQEAPGTLAALADMGRHVAGDKPVDAIVLGYGGTVRRANQRPRPCFHERGWEDVDALAYLGDAFCAPVLIESWDCPH